MTFGLTEALEFTPEAGAPAFLTKTRPLRSRFYIRFKAAQPYPKENPATIPDHLFYLSGLRMPASHHHMAVPSEVLSQTLHQKESLL